MAIRPQSATRNVHGITEAEAHDIKTFMQGAVYSWIRDRPGDPFSVRDLMGGANFVWHGTPLQVLYNKHAEKGHDGAVAAAGQDLGWLVKAMLDSDKRTFDATHEDLVATYRWLGGEP